MPENKRGPGPGAGRTMAPAGRPRVPFPGNAGRAAALHRAALRLVRRMDGNPAARSLAGESTRLWLAAASTDGTSTADLTRAAAALAAAARPGS